MLRKIASTLLGAITGLLIVGIIFGAVTFFVYFIGIYLGIPLGICIGGWLGWKTSLRNSMLLFVACYGGLIAGIPLGKWLSQGQQNDPMMQWILPIVVPVGMVLLAGGVCLAIASYIPFENRRRLAFIASGFALSWMIWQVYHYIYLWQPGS